MLKDVGYKSTHRCMCLKGLVTAAFGSSEPFYIERWVCHVGAIPTQRVYQLSEDTIWHTTTYETPVKQESKNIKMLKDVGMTV